MLTANGVHEKARIEWVSGSGVDLELFELNVNSSHIASSGKDLTGWRSFSVGSGYWWCNTIEPRTGTELERGELKLFDAPIIKGKPCKYATFPANQSPPPGLMKVPGSVWMAVAERNGINPASIEESKDVTRDDHGFWKWVLDRRLPIYICEGRKKAAAMLTQGYCGVSVNGVWNGTKKWKANHRRIIDGLVPFLQSESEICMVYDSDFVNNPQVMEALKNFNQTLKGSCPSLHITIATWGLNEGKGIDDLLVNCGEERFHEVINSREPFSEWIASVVLPDSFEDQVLNHIAEAGIHWIYCNKSIHQWVGTHYEPVEDEAVEAQIYEHLRKFADPDKGAESQTNAGNAKWANRVQKQIRLRYFVSSEEMNPAGHFNLLNGVVKVETNTEDRFVYWDFGDRAWDYPPYFDYCCEFEWNPNARSPHWENIKAALDEPYRSILFKTLAASVDLGAVRRVHGRGTRCLFLLGAGNNGKDTPRTVIDQIFGASVTSLSMSEVKNADSTGDCNHLWPLKQSRINWSSEAKPVRLERNDILKAMLTGEPLRVRRMRMDGEIIRPSCTMIFTSNNAPVIGTAAEAIRSRFGVIWFRNKYVANPTQPGELKAEPRYKEDPQFLLEEVTPTAFLDLLRLYKDVIENGIDYSPLDEAYTEIQEESSHLSRFISDIGLKRSPGHNTPLSELWEQLKNWYVLEEMAILVEGTPKPLDNDRYDPVVVSKRKIKGRLLEIDPELELTSINDRGTRRCSVLQDWKITTPILT